MTSFMPINHHLISEREIKREKERKHDALSVCDEFPRISDREALNRLTDVCM